VVLYGGGSTNNPGTDPNDQAGSTWIWKGDDWYRLPELDPPAPQYSFTAIEENPLRDRLVFTYAKTQPGGYGHETWQLQDGKFTRLPCPPFSSISSLLFGAYHEALDKTLVPAEYDQPWQGILRATYVWDGVQWSTNPPPPSGLNWRAMTYDPDRQALLTLHAASGQVYALYSLTQGWVPLAGVVVPGAQRRDYSFCYDRARRRLVYAWGIEVVSGAAPGDTWEHDGVTWQQVITSQPGPVNMNSVTSRYVPEVGGILLTGYNLTSLGQEMEHWVWDGSSWTQLLPDYRPSWVGQTFFPIYDARRGRMRIVTGDICGNLRTESLVWDLEFRSLVPDTYHPRLGSLVSLAIEQKTEPGSFFGVLLSGDDFPGVPLPGLTRILPLKSDGILSLGLFPGMFGVLDSQGRATARLRIANDPRLIGLDLHAAMVTLRTNGTLGTVSNRVQMDIIR
jgi:hypothetical protein